MQLTANQRLAVEILGHLPAGYVVVAADHNTSAPYRHVGSIHINGRCVCMFDATRYFI